MGAYIINVPSTVDRIIYVNVHPMDGKTYLASYSVDELTPYTAPDLEQVRKEGYEKGWKEAEDNYFDGYSNGYDAGLDDAWKAARKIWEYDPTTLKEIFGEEVMRMDWFMKVTASEVIEKIFAYEQAQKELEQEQEEIKVGDEVIPHHITADSTPVIVTRKWKDDYNQDAIHTIGYDGRTNCFLEEYVEKTGRTFPEIAEVLAKMKETDNG